MALGQFGGTAGSLGTLYVNLTANASGLTQGMATAVAAVAGGAMAIEKSLEIVAKAFIDLGKVGIETFSKFDQAMTQSSAIMSGMGRNMRTQMEATARSIALDGIIPADKLAKTYYDLGSAGLNAQQSIKALPVVAQFATAGVIDINKATRNLIGSMNALGLTMKDPVQNMENMARLADVLVKGNNVASGSVEDFSDALANKAAGAMRSFNIEAETGIAVLAALAQKNIIGLKAGEEFSIIMQQLAYASRNNAQAFRDFGVQVFDNNGKVKNLADVFLQLEENLGKMTPELGDAQLELLGFQQRSIQVIRTLMGSSGDIRKFAEDLRNAGGEAKRVSDIQMTSFSNQVTLLGHSFQELFIVVGEQLAPSIKIIAKDLRDLLNDESFMKWVKDIAYAVGVTLAGAFGTLIDVLKFARFTVLSLSLAFVYVAEQALYAWNGMALTLGVIVNTIANGIKSAFNGVLIGINYIIDKLPDKMKSILGMGKITLLDDVELDFTNKKVEDWASKLNATRQDILKTLATDFMGTYKAVNEGTQKIADKTIDKFHEIKKAIDDADAAMQSASHRMQELMTKLGAPEGKNFLGMGRREMMSNKELDADNAALKLSGKAKDNFVPMTSIEKQLAIGEGIQGDSGSLQALQLQKEIQQNQTRMDLLKKFADQEVALNEETQKRKAQALELYTKRALALQRQQVQMELGAASNMFDSLSSIAKTWGGEQSATYKAMFAISKAFAIAQSTVAIMQGIAMAAATPWPANIAAMAQVAAATASIVSNISAVSLSFGGGKQSGGDVDTAHTYLVGERGPELFTPSKSGSIIPNHQLGMGGGKTTVVVNNYSDATATVTEKQNGDDKMIEVIVRKVENVISSGIRDGRGNVNRAMESTFKNLKRTV